MAEPASTRITLTVSSEVYSFLLFCGLTLAAILLFRAEYEVFLVIVVLDGLGTLVGVDALVSVDRSAFFFFALIFSVAVADYSLLYLFLEAALFIAALDFSFLLRTTRDTEVDPSVYRRRLASYAYTIMPAFVLSYSLAFAYSFLSGAATVDPLALVAVCSTLALYAIYAVSRYLSPRTAGGKTGAG